VHEAGVKVPRSVSLRGNDHPAPYPESSKLKRSSSLRNDSLAVRQFPLEAIEGIFQRRKQYRNLKADVVKINDRRERC